MGNRCERCGTDWGGIRFREEEELPEDVEPGYYCEDCFESMIRNWSESELAPFTFDNEGNRADSPDYNEDNSWFEDSD
jgi:hypothetical protein